MRVGLEKLQPLGRALMLPIAVLPIAALLLRLGQPDMLDIAFVAAALILMSAACTSLCWLLLPMVHVEQIEAHAAAPDTASDGEAPGEAVTLRLHVRGDAHPKGRSDPRGEDPRSGPLDLVG